MRIRAIDTRDIAALTDNSATIIFSVHKDEDFIVIPEPLPDGNTRYVFEMPNVKITMDESTVKQNFTVERKNQDAFYWVPLDENGEEYKCPCCGATAPLSYEDMYYRGGKRRAELSDYCPSCGKRLYEY